MISICRNRSRLRSRCPDPPPHPSYQSLPRAPIDGANRTHAWRALDRRSASEALHWLPRAFPRSADVTRLHPAIFAVCMVINWLISVAGAWLVSLPLVPTRQNSVVALLLHA